MESNVRQVSEARRRALIDRDLHTLAKLLSDNLRYVHATGVAHDRDGYLRFVQGAFQFLDVQLTEPCIKVIGEVAIVTGRLAQQVIRLGESTPVMLSSWAIEVWEYQNGIWLLSNFQSTRLPSA